MSNFRSLGLLALCAATLLLAACGKNTSPPVTASPAEEPPAATAANAPIPADQLGATLALVGSPGYDSSDDTVHARISITNTGRVALSSKGAHIFNLGVMLVGPDGPDKVPGNRNFVRVPLPLVAPGSQIEVDAVLPAEPLLNLAVRADLVQENVSWFAGYGYATLEIGTFQRCDGEPRTLCDDNGNPVIAAQ